MKAHQNFKKPIKISFKKRKYVDHEKLPYNKRLYPLSMDYVESYGIRLKFGNFETIIPVPFDVSIFFL